MRRSTSAVDTCFDESTITRAPDTSATERYTRGESLAVAGEDGPEGRRPAAHERRQLRCSGRPPADRPPSVERRRPFGHPLNRAVADLRPERALRERAAAAAVVVVEQAALEEVDDLADRDHVGELAEHALQQRAAAASRAAEEDDGRIGHRASSPSIRSPTRVIVARASYGGGGATAPGLEQGFLDGAAEGVLVLHAHRAASLVHETTEGDLVVVDHLAEPGETGQDDRHPAGLQRVDDRAGPRMAHDDVRLSRPSTGARRPRRRQNRSRAAAGARDRAG